MHSAALLLFQIFILYILSYRLQQQLSLFFHYLFRNDRLVMWTMALLFLPGTLIHELSHLIVARMLLVRAGGLTIIPRNAGDGTIRMGSVQMPKPDPIRRFLIGIAPVCVGIILLLLAMWWMENFDWVAGWVEWLVVGYAIFQIANSLFASKKDMEGALGLFVVIGLLLGGAYWFGWRPSIEWFGPWLTQHESFLSQVVLWLWVPIGIDALVLVSLWPLLKLLRHTY